jgi:sulfite oxidase
VATLHCAGNRRSELADIAPIPRETPWREAAIGNARWAGVRLRDVLAAAGVRDGAAHVELVGADETTEFGGGFGGSVPLGVDVLLAFEMNGAPLEPVHGFPLRAVVPGYIGARSVKWLERVNVIAAPSANPFHARSYKLFAPGVRAEDADWDGTEPLGETPLNSAICKVTADGVMGWACAGGDRSVDRVEVGDGSGWQAARLGGDGGPGAWRLWRAALDLPPGEHELVVRAWDSAGNTQPQSAAEIWNFKGYANNAWHRVRVRIE